MVNRFVDHFLCFVVRSELNKCPIFTKSMQCEIFFMNSKVSIAMCVALSRYSLEKSSLSEIRNELEIGDTQLL